MPKKAKKQETLEDKVMNELKRLTARPLNTLGIDLSIGKIKLCLLSLHQEQKRIGGGWSSLPVNFEPVAEKEYEFSHGFVIAIEAFLKHHGLEPADIKSVVFCTGGAYYMFRTFADGLRYVGGLLKMVFPRQKVYFIRCDGELSKLNDIFDLPDSEASAFSSTNFLGTAILAAKQFENGLAIDMGTISTSIIPVINGRIDPVAAYNPAGYTLHRYSTGKHIWYGVMHTQLTYITHQAKTQRALYNLILRSCNTNTLCSLLNLIEPSVANVHVQEGSRIPEREMSLIRMAETVGVDINSLPEAELIDIARDIYYQCIYKIGDIVRRILANANYRSFDELKVLAAGLGQEAFIIPALYACGFNRNQIITVAEDKHSNLWSATSVYGLALLAMEELIGEKIPVNIENPG